MWISILGFIIRMCIYTGCVMILLLPICGIRAYSQHLKKVERIERRRREIFGDDD